MIKSFTVTNYLGDSIKLSLAEPEKTGFAILSVTGLNPPKANINTTDMASVDGSLYNSARLDKRNIVFTILFVESDTESIEDIRHKSYKYFPLKKKLDIMIETDRRSVRTTGYVESNEALIFSEQVGTTISVICPDPYFYDAGNTVITDFYTVEPTFEFPFSNESTSDPLLVFGEFNLVPNKAIRYDGDADVGITVRIHAIGAAKNVSLYNLGTREVMKIDTDKLADIAGSGIIGKDDIIITTSKGNKSITLIRDGISYNILNCLDRNADWLCLRKGDNTFAFTADEGITNLQLQIEHQIIYEGA